MAELSQVRAFAHQRRQPFAGCVGRAVIDEDNLVRPASIERGRDLDNQWSNVVGFIANRHYNRHRRRRGAGIGWVLVHQSMSKDCLLNGPPEGPATRRLLTDRTGSSQPLCYG